MAGTKGARTSARLVASMLELIQASGYSGTGMNTVVAHARAPKGSLYFHFPEGKEALGEQAIELAADQYRSLVVDSTLAAATPGEAVRHVTDALAGLLTDSDFQLGCPVSVITLEMGARSERLRGACANAYDSWIEPVTEYLVAHGHERATAHALATTMVSTVEGAIILSRAQRSVAPLHCAGQVLAGLLEVVP